MSSTLEWEGNFDKRQLQEIRFCRLYAKEFAHGTDGHNAKLIIAKMADLLDVYVTDIEMMGQDFSEVLKHNEK